MYERACMHIIKYDAIVMYIKERVPMRIQTICRTVDQNIKFLINFLFV